MITGRTIFARSTLSDTIAAVLERDPDLDPIRSTAPAVATLVKRCLVKDPKRRLRDIGDLGIEIDEILSTPAGASTATASAATRTSRVGMLAVAGLALFAAAAAGLVFYRSRADTADERPMQLTLSLTDQSAEFATTSVPSPSPDGRQFVFIGTNEKGVSTLWIRPVEAGVARSIPGTEEGGG
jgi:serine/threonine-protein kinase